MSIGIPDYIPVGYALSIGISDYIPLGYALSIGISDYTPVGYGSSIGIPDYIPVGYGLSTGIRRSLRQPDLSQDGDPAWSQEPDCRLYTLLSGFPFEC